MRIEKYDNYIWLIECKSGVLQNLAVAFADFYLRGTSKYFRAGPFYLLFRNIFVFADI